jgi:hypothetical protein
MVNRPSLSPETDLENAQSAWIIFSDDTDIRMLRLFRRGFRHCFMMVQSDDRWLLIDPRSNKTDVHLLPHPKSFNFPRYYTEQGKTVIKIPAIQTPHKILSPFPVSCVETLKRLIGLHAWWVITPYQLYKILLKLQHKKGS